MTPTGRFAPSPSGPLHAGSLLAALGSFVDAKQRQGRWLLRIDDIDPERSKREAGDDIIRCLAQHGLLHDGEIRYASRATAEHMEALSRLWERGHVYACRCTRAQLRAAAQLAGNGHYPGTCRPLGLAREGHAARLIVDPFAVVRWRCALERVHSESVAAHTGDFVLHRRDGVIAYQLAVVVDDHMDGVTSVVRGADLLDNTARQVHLQHLLEYSSPMYLHLPVLIGPDERKLSKSNGAQAVDPAKALANLLNAWAQLNQPKPPTSPQRVDQFLNWAIQNWNRELAACD